MSTKHALLGVLLHRPTYPYDLAERLQARLGPAWTLNSGQLYQTIERMAQEGLIERVAGDPERGEGRHIYKVTESGLEEFDRWFAETTGGARLARRSLLAKISLGGPARLKDTLRQIDAYELDCATRLKEITGRREAVPVEGTRVRADNVLLRLGLSADIFQLEGELRWARYAHEIVSWLLAQEAIWLSAAERSGDQSDEERQGARAELFGRMAQRHLRSISDESETET